MPATGKILCRRRSGFVEALEPRYAPSAGGSTAPPPPTAPAVIDLLVLYTPGAAAFHSGDLARLTDSVRGAVDSTNQALVQSHIPALVRVAGFQQVNYVGTDDLFVDRTRLANPNDGFLDEAHALRDQYGADLVTLVVETHLSAGGNASLPTTPAELNSGQFVFSANAVNSVAPGNLTLAHELGHNLGAGHERGNPDQTVGPYPYSYGYRFTAGDGNLYHDLMSYDPGQVIFHYANPSVSFLGAPTGRAAPDPLSADLHATFVQTTPVIAAFRAPVVADTSGPAGTVYQVSRRPGGLLDFIVRWSDPGGVDASTIDDDDVTVNYPASLGGFVLLGERIEVHDGAGVGGAYKLATYRVALPDPAVAIEDLSFHARAGAVRDAAGNLSPAGAIARNTDATVANAGFAAARFLGLLDAPVTIYESIRSLGFAGDDTFRFDVASAGTISVHLEALTGDAQVFLARDADGNGRYDPGTDFLGGSFNSAAAPESIALNVPAGGTYFAWVYAAAAGVQTPYELSIRHYADSTAPSAALDATDVASPQSQFVFNVMYFDDQEIDAVLARYYTPVRLTNPFGGFYIAFAESIDREVNGPLRVVTYRINAGFTLSSADNGVYTVATEPHDSPIFSPPLDRRMADAAGNPLAPATLGTFRVSIGQPDTTPPEALPLSPLTLDVPRTALRFAVTLRDNVALDAGTLDNADFHLTGPNGFDQPATLVSISPAPAVGGRRSAVYEVTGPGGSWDFMDRGMYQIRLRPDAVRDASGNAAAGGVLGTLWVTIPLPGDANRDGVVNIADFAVLAANFNTRSRGFSGGDFNHDNAVNIADFGLLAANFNQSSPMADELFAVDASEPLSR